MQRAKHPHQFVTCIALVSAHIVMLNHSFKFPIFSLFRDIKGKTFCQHYKYQCGGGFYYQVRLWPNRYRLQADYLEVEGSSPTQGNYFEIFFIFSLSLFRLKILFVCGEKRPKTSKNYYHTVKQPYSRKSEKIPVLSEDKPVQPVPDSNYKLQGSNRGEK